MINLTPSERIIMLSRAKRDPSTAFMQAVDVLTERMNKAIEDALGDKPNMTDLELAVREGVTADLSKEFTNLEAVLTRLEKNLKGTPGNDAKPEDVAALLLANEEFKATLKGKDANAPTSEALLALITPLIPTVKDGVTPTHAELVKLIKSVMPKVKDGKTPTAKELSRLITAQLKANGMSLKSVLKAINMPDTVEQVAVKDLKTTLERLWQAVRAKPRQHSGGSGGGMGNWVHQSFALTAVTTSVTLNSRVAAAGHACLVRYQGQLLAEGVQYSAPGTAKSIALLFTPEDSTTLDVTYVRT